MKLITFDVETYRIAPGRKLPPLVCMSWTDGEVTRLVKRTEAVALMRGWLEDDRVLLSNHNIAFDLGVFAALDPRVFLPLIFDAYDAGRIFCTMIRQQLLDIALGTMSDDKSYSLEELVKVFFAETVTGKHGEDAWRLRYRELEDVALVDWPEEARRYAMLDAEYAHRVTRAQMEMGEIPDFHNQCRASFALTLVGAWGIRTDGERVARLEKILHENVDQNLLYLQEQGIYRVGGTKKEPKLVKTISEIQRRVFEELGDRAPMTEGGAKKAALNKDFRAEYVSTDAETLELCKDPGLRTLAEISGDQKLLNTYIPLLKTGESLPICPRWNTLVKSGRTSCKKPNLQNQPRKPGVRECFIPRPGWVFISSDYHTAELRSLAQVLLDMFGQSKMADALRAGKDLHLVTGSSILGITHAEILEWYHAPHTAACVRNQNEKWICSPDCLQKKAKDARQLSKAINFGFPGGLGAASFVEYAAGPDYRIEISPERAKMLRDTWLASYPEMDKYFKDISFRCNQNGGTFTLEQPRSGRLRGDCGYTDGANTRFQGLTADGMKDAMWHIIKEMYDPRCYTSHLYGTRMNAIIHDEVFMEAPEDRAAEAGERLSEVMVERMSVWLPDIPVKADAALMRRWSKEAGDPVRDKSSRLIPWEDREQKKG